MTEVLYYHADYKGSEILITGQTPGEGVQGIGYWPFGAVRSMITNPNHVVDVRHKFTGQELDNDLGLYYYGGRWYDPETGRFISPDSYVQAPLNPQSLNRYSYVINNPTNFVDPSGHFWFLPALVLLVTAEAAVKGAIIGAIVGGITSVVTGRPIGSGILNGAIYGAIGNIARPIIGGIIGGFAGGIAETLGASNAAASAIGKVLGAAASGAATGGAGAAVTGDDVGRGAATGGITGGVTGSGALQYVPTVVGAIVRMVKKLITIQYSDTWAEGKGMTLNKYKVLNLDLGNLKDAIDAGNLLKIAKEAGNTLFDLVFPNYGNFGGRHLGTEQYKEGEWFNSKDLTNFIHDTSTAPHRNWDWLVNSLPGHAPPGTRPTGLFGIAYTVYGAPPLALSEVPNLVFP